MHSEAWVILRDETRVLKLPLAWTDGGPVDPFVVQAAGRALFRPADLVGLAEFVSKLRREV